MSKPVVGIVCNNRMIQQADREHMEMAYAMTDYIKSLESVGCIPIMIPVLQDYNDYKVLLNSVDGLLITGGADVDPVVYNQPHRFGLGNVFEHVDRAQIYLINYAMDSDIPTLGICKGCQIMNVALGGSLYQDIGREIKDANNHSQTKVRYGVSHSINIVKDSLLNNIFESDSIDVNSFHHQSIHNLGKKLDIVATAEDGVVEAIEAGENRFFLGVQWHPEMMMSGNDKMKVLFEAFSHSMK